MEEHRDTVTRQKKWRFRIFRVFSLLTPPNPFYSIIFTIMQHTLLALISSNYISRTYFKLL